MIKIVHVITDLDVGGAEMMLHKLLLRTDRAVFSPQVISLTDIGPIGKEIQALGIPTRSLGMRPGFPNPLKLLKLAWWLSRADVRLLQTWMYHADLIGGLAALLAGKVTVVWGIHHSNLERSNNRRSTILTAKICARLSTLLPKAIVCCSDASRRVHTALGYSAKKMVVIPNGIDYSLFAPDQKARSSLRDELGLPGDTPLIGLFARFAPLKDQHNFIKAAKCLSGQASNTHYLLCGEGVEYSNRTLAGWIDQAGLRDSVHLLGPRKDIPRLMAAMDIAASSSLGEGFPNVIVEAMSCAVPCAVTDVGDSAYIVGDTGSVVPPSDHRALAAAWLELIEMGAERRRSLGALARERVIDNFALAAIVGQYEALYKEVVKQYGKN